MNLKVSLIFKLFLRVFITGWALLPVLEKQIQVNLCESVANLVYMASSMSARDTERGSASNNNSNDVWIKVSWILFITDSVVFFYKVVNYSLVEYLMTEKCKSNSEHWSQWSNGPSSCHWMKISFAVNPEAVTFSSKLFSISRSFT